MEHQDLYSGLIRLHILHHAAEEPIFALGIIEELGRHGYKLSAGTLYPILHGLEARGYLRSKEERSGKRFRRVYRATPLSRKVLEQAREKVRELFGELFESEAGLENGRPKNGRTAYGGETEEFMRMPFDELAQQVAAGSLRVTVGRTFKLDQIVEAHRCMEENRAGGKIVVLTQAPPSCAAFSDGSWRGAYVWTDAGSAL